ncbi:Hypothetical predicted protein [Pelobates cultripes]|uniref:UPAR/Ly6 domain-containing protein n=1 Tax=Pelobates cultripes TaxID=61616 RepID=A0AAD1WL62_PELCU|nr:Hypothetical predicted protein [Pelobates cultripes]
MANHVMLFGFLFAFLATGNQTLTSFTRSCNDDPYRCDKDLQMVGGIQNTFITTTCCNTDNCNKHEIQVSEHNNTVNGRLCEVCYGLDSYNCNINGYIECRGDQTDCVDIAVTLEKIGSSLTCMQCSTVSETSCRGAPHVCNKNDTSCIDILEITKVGNQTLIGFTRSCNDDPYRCDKDFQMVGGIKNTFITTTCCNTDNCNKHEIQVSEHNNTVNGRLCEVCYGMDSYNCNINGYIQCRGDQTECVDIAVTLEKIDSSTFTFSLKGCATPDACTLGPKIIPAAKITEEKRLLCYRAHRIVQ